MPLPALPAQGQNPWYIPRQNWDDAVEAALEGRLSDSTLAQTFIKPLSRTGTGANAPLTYINAADYGAVSGSSSDQAPAIQAAINAAGPGGVVHIPAGTYRCETGLTLPAWTTLEANSPILAAGGSAAVELRFALTGATTAVTMGAYSTLRRIKVRGPGTAVGTVTGVRAASATFDEASIINFNTGVHLTDGYYSSFYRCEITRNATGLRLTNCYNVNLVVCQFYCGSTVDDSPQTAIAGAARGLNIFGGAIEGYRYAISLTSAQALGLYGVYFETKVDANALAIQAAGLSAVTVTALGCMVFLNGHNRWLGLSGSTNATAVAHGNHFVAVEASVQAPIAYIISHEQSNVIGPDNWAEVSKTGAAYASVSGGALPARGSIVSLPVGWSTGPNVLDGRRILEGFLLQVHSTAGAVTFDSRYEKHVINLSANATASVISNASNIAQEMEISWVQDGTGGRTYAWPSGCRFASNSAPTDTTANTQTTVRFRYNTSTGHWVELSRAVGVPN